MQRTQTTKTSTQSINGNESEGDTSISKALVLQTRLELDSQKSEFKTKLPGQREAKTQIPMAHWTAHTHTFAPMHIDT